MTMFRVTILAWAGSVAAASVSDYNALNSTVGGKLYKAYPLAKPCYSVYEGSLQKPDTAACSDIQKGYTTDTSIVTHYSGFINTNWATCQLNASGCPLDFSQPSNPLVYAPPSDCHQGIVSPYYIDVRSERDIQAGLEFARKNKVPISIKNSGHDYKGRNSAPGSLALWTHNLQPPITLTKAFVPDGCSSPVGDGVTFGAGQGFLGLYEFAEAHNITIVGGSSPTVGAAGGWITGGGHSAVSNTLGLGVDNVQQLKAVLPNGTFVTANACQNQDIFFALRGGGGSTFGVITDMTTRANPQVTLQVAFIALASLDPASVRKFIQLCADNAATWADGGWGGYISPAAVTQQTSGFVLVTPKLSLAEAKAQMKPLTDFAASFGNLALSNSVATEPSYFQMYQKYLVPYEEKVGLGTSIGSRLIPRSVFTSNASRDQLVDTLANIGTSSSYPESAPLNPLSIGYGSPLQFLVTAPSSYKLPPGGDTSAVTPAWRQALWHIFVNHPFATTASAHDIQSAFQATHKATQMLQAVAPDSGAYQNEADTFQDDAPTNFWGQANYQRLQGIKGRLDPDNLLTCHQCVGWNANDARYGCYPKI